MKVTNHKYGHGYHRKLHLTDGVWTWRYAGGRIWIRSPDGKRTIHTNPFEVTGEDEKEWYNYMEHREMTSIDMSPYPVFTPKDLVQFVEVRFLAIV